VFNANNFESEQKQDDLNAIDRSFLLGGCDEINQDEFLRQKILEDSVFGTKQNPVPWESSKTPANEFRTNGLISMCFPTLFADGTGDFSDRDRKISVSLHEALPHFMHFADVHSDGSLTYRFASNPSFPFWIF
jgi:hypothetical protein